MRTSMVDTEGENELYKRSSSSSNLFELVWSNRSSKNMLKWAEMWNQGMKRKEKQLKIEFSIFFSLSFFDVASINL